MAAELLITVAAVFAVNLLPAFGPPTWAVLVFFRYRFPDLPIAAVVAGGAVAASTGRLLLAIAFRHLAGHLPQGRREHLEETGRAIAARRSGLLASFALFVTAPLPSAQLFEAAGLARVRLGPLLAAFALGRLVSYSIYVGAATAAHDSLARLLGKGLLSPAAIATQVLALALLAAAVLVDWPALIARRRAGDRARR